MTVKDVIDGFREDVEENPERDAYADTLFQEAIRISMELDNQYHTPEEIREIMGRLTGKKVDESFRLFPPFYTDFGKNITIGRGSRIYTQDILLNEAEDEIGYFVVEDEETAVDVVWGEIVALGRLRAGDISIVGNTVDYPDFIEGMRYHVENGLNVPYLPSLNVMATPLPFLKMTCLKCGYVTLGCCYVARHKDCGGFFTMDFATKIYRKGEKEKAFA